MSLPVNFVAVNGQGSVQDVNLNAMVQGVLLLSGMQSFIGSDSMIVYMNGTNAVNDGGQGNFYWNTAGTLNDGVNGIVPNGSLSGNWTRLVTSADPPVPTTITGTNLLVLTPNANTPPFTGYSNYQIFTGVAAATTTGAVTAYAVGANGPLPALPVYLPTGSQAGSGSIVLGSFLMLAYVSSLNGGAGGFAIVNQPNSTGSFAPISNPNFSGTAELNSHPLITQVNELPAFTATGTYTPTPGMVYCKIQSLGGGGGGGGVGTASGGGGAGGGGYGGFSEITVAAAVIGASQPVTIGAAGTGAASGANTGGSGGDTSVGSICIGKGATGGSSQPTTSSTTSNGGAGGIAGTGSVTAPGAPGGFGSPPAGVNGVGQFGGAGGSGPYGGGGAGISVYWTQSAPGNAGTGYGAGGSGGVTGGQTPTAEAGGAGTAGLVIITEYISA